MEWVRMYRKTGPGVTKFGGKLTPDSRRGRWRRAEITDSTRGIDK